MNRYKIEEKNWKELKCFFYDLEGIIEELRGLKLLALGEDNVYENMYKLSSKIGKRVERINDNFLMVKETQWERLKKAGLELDEIVEDSIHRDEYKKSSNRLWEVINEVENLKKCKGCKDMYSGDELSECSKCRKWFCDNDLQWTSEEGEERFCHSCWFIIKKVEKVKGGNE